MLTHRNLTANAMHGVGVMGLTHRIRTSTQVPNFTSPTAQ